MAGDNEPSPSVRSYKSLDARIGFDDNRHTPQRRTREISSGRLRIFACGGRHRALDIPGFDGLIDPVILLDASGVPFDNLRDRISMSRVKPYQLWNGDLGKIAIDCAGNGAANGSKETDSERKNQ